MLITATELKPGMIVKTDSTGDVDVDGKWLTVVAVASSKTEVRIEFRLVRRAVFFNPLHGLQLRGLF